MENKHIAIAMCDRDPTLCISQHRSSILYEHGKCARKRILQNILAAESYLWFMKLQRNIWQCQRREKKNKTHEPQQNKRTQYKSKDIASCSRIDHFTKKWPEKKTLFLLTCEMMVEKRFWRSHISLPQSLFLLKVSSEDECITFPFAFNFSANHFLFFFSSSSHCSVS